MLNCIRNRSLPNAKKGIEHAQWKPGPPNPIGSSPRGLLFGQVQKHEEDVETISACDGRLK
jgi:hypothetical protein